MSSETWVKSTMNPKDRINRVSPRYYFGVSQNKDGITLWRTAERVRVLESPHNSGTPISTIIIDDLYLEEARELLDLMTNLDSIMKVRT